MTWLGAMVRGAVAGLAGGLAFGAAMIQLGVLANVALLIRVQSPIAGFFVHLAIAVLLGALFGLLVRQQAAGVGETLFWGLAYGMVWWYLGALTLLPLLLGRPVTWSAASGLAAISSLLGHLVYGTVVGVVFGLLRWKNTASTVTVGAAVRGLLAGVAAVWLVTAVVGAAYAPVAVSPAMTRLFVVASTGLGLLCGLGFALISPSTGDAAGPALIRGAGVGFVLWVLLGLTFLPLAETGRLAWSADAVRGAFPTLPAYLLLGAATARFATWLGGLTRLLFTGPAARADEEGPGARSLRAVGRGVLAGLAGGLVFTVVMVQVGYLGRVARLVGSSSELVGEAVHLLISVVVGASYGLLFRRQTHDPASALGWGTAYGFLWWVLGGLTLLPILLGGDPQWTATAAGRTFPSLIGHLGYGAALGLLFYLLERRHDPWWVSRDGAVASRARRHREYLESSAPAVWVLVVLMALTVTLVLG